MDSLVVSHDRIAGNLGIPLPAALAQSRDSVPASLLSGDARDSAVLRCLNEITNDRVTVSGEHRRGDWDSGWAQHKIRYQEDGIQGLVPDYFTKHPYARINGHFAEASGPLLELRLLRLLQEVVGYTFLSDLECIAEFGCGTGHNLIHAHSTYGTGARLLGFDWAESSQTLLSRVATDSGMQLHGYAFDYFNPDSFSPLQAGTGVMTMCSLEQVGTNFREFISYLVAQKPAIVVHIEPLVELLDPSRLTDWLSIEYARKRGYLNGLVPYLATLEENGTVEILLTARSGVGSFLIDGYQVCVWKPTRA